MEEEITMRAIIDVEADNLLADITQAWCIIVNPLTEGTQERIYDVFVPDEYVVEGPSSKLTLKPLEKVHIRPLSTFKEYSAQITEWIGHNIINYDSRALYKLGLVDKIPVKNMTDTMILSQITSPKRKGGHSLDSWGMRFDDFKGKWEDFSKFDWEMVDYCLQDVRITRRLHGFMSKNVENFSKFSVRLEHQVRDILDEMQDNGFALDQERAHKLYVEIKEINDKLSEKIQNSFPPEKIYFKKLYPRVTASGIIHGQDKRTIDNNPHDTVVDEFGVTYYHLYNMVDFNLRSPAQIVARMDQLGWEPVVFNEPSDGALYKAACEFLKVDHEKADEKQRQVLIKKASKAGWDEGEVKGSPKVCEENFETLPEDAPESAKLIATWFLYDKRMQKLDEWFNKMNVKTGCIQGRVFGCGAWTHRMTHSDPNTANISKIGSKKVSFSTEKELDDFISTFSDKHDVLEVTKKADKFECEIRVWGEDGKFSTDMRACFTTRDRKTRRLVGVDLAGIQLRAFAHYAYDKDYTEQILSGDIHVYNRDILRRLSEEFIKNSGKSLGIGQEEVEFLSKNPKAQRNSAKTFIYAYLLGAGNKKVGKILGFPEIHQMAAGKSVKEGFVSSISGLEQLKKNINKWVKQGFMVGLDGRLISLTSAHLAMGAALQSFEAIVMKYTLVLARAKIKKEGLDALLVGVIHDECQWDVKIEHCKRVGEIVVESMEEAGRYFKSNVPITGEYNIGTTWADSH